MNAVKKCLQSQSIFLLWVEKTTGGLTANAQPNTKWPFQRVTGATIGAVFLLGNARGYADSLSYFKLWTWDFLAHAHLCITWCNVHFFVTTCALRMSTSLNSECMSDHKWAGFLVQMYNSGEKAHKLLVWEAFIDKLPFCDSLWSWGNRW